MLDLERSIITRMINISKQDKTIVVKQISLIIIIKKRTNKKIMTKK